MRKSRLRREPKSTKLSFVMKMGFGAVLSAQPFSDKDVCVNESEFGKAIKKRNRCGAPEVGDFVVLVQRYDAGKRYKIQALGMQVRDLMVHWIMFNEEFKDEMMLRETCEWRPKGIVIKIDPSWFSFSEYVHTSAETLKRFFGLQ